MQNALKKERKKERKKTHENNNNNKETRRLLGLSDLIKIHIGGQLWDWNVPSAEENHLRTKENAKTE